MIDRGSLARFDGPGLAGGPGRLAGHQIGAEAVGVGGDLLQVGLPALQLLLGVGQDLAGLGGVAEGLADVARYDGRVVQAVEEAAPVLGEDDLLLGALDGGGELEVEGFLELLTGLTRMSGGFCPERLRE